MRRIRIVHIITGLERGGAETMLVNLVRQMDRQQFRNEIISLNTLGALGNALAKQGLSVRALGLKDGRFWNWFRLIYWLRKLRPDIVQTWMYHADLLGGVAARLAGVPQVSWGIHHSDLSPGFNQPGILRLAKACSCFAKFVPEKIVCCSESAKQTHMACSYPEEKLSVIQNGFDLRRFMPDPDAYFSVRRELDLPISALLVGLTARFHPQKDHQSFIIAADIVSRRMPNAHFLLCGEGVTTDNKELMAWLERHQLVERCHLLGLRSDMPRLMTALDVAVLSSRGEAMPLVLGEAMACAVPCVATDVGDTALLVGTTGRIVPTGDPKAFAAAIVELLCDSDLRRRLGKKARQRIEDHYSLEKTVTAYQEHFRALVCSSESHCSDVGADQ